MRRAFSSGFDWFFRDRRSGRITVAQFPNVALWIFLATVAVRRVVTPSGTARAVLDAVGVGSLAWWAVDEICRGANPWRRLLGLGGTVFAVLGLVSLVR